jgi:hypothetical protein
MPARRIASGRNLKAGRGAQIEASSRDRRRAREIRAREELKALNSVLAAPGRWLESVHLLKPEADEKEAFAEVLKRKRRLEEFVAGAPRRLGRRPKIERGRPPDILRMQIQEPRREIGMNWAAILALLQANQHQDCHVISIGQIRASGFREYAWARPENASGTVVFWPLSRTSIFPSSTFFGDWTGEIGVNFFGNIRVSPGIFVDPLDSVASAAVLQFTIPAPRCDATLAWGTFAVANGDSPWFMNADFARIDTDWVIHESPSGGDFPASLTDSFEFIADGMFDSTTREPEMRNVFSFDRSFNVAAGVSPRIYLGCSLMLMAADGEASTFKTGGQDDRFKFEHGITYIMVSQSP